MFLCAFLSICVSVFGVEITPELMNRSLLNFFSILFFYCLQNHIHISTKKSQMNMFKKPSTTELHLYK